MSLEVPGTVSGNFSFCLPSEYEVVSTCGPSDNPLGSATFTGTGTDTADLICSGSGGCGLYADYLEPFTATVDMSIVPEPPTLALVLGASLFACPTLLCLRRHSPRPSHGRGPANAARFQPGPVSHQHPAAAFCSSKQLKARS